MTAGQVAKTGFWGLVVIAGGYVVYKLLNLGGAVGAALTSTGEAIGGGIYTAINGDTNAQVQSNVQQALAALKRVGSPPPGTTQYNDVVVQYGIAPAPVNLATQATYDAQVAANGG